MIQSWLLLSIIALLIWGSWGVLATLTSRYLDGFSALVWEVAGALVVGIAALLWLSRTSGLEVEVRGASLGVLTGIAYTVGLGFLFFALSSAARTTSEGGGGSNVHTILVLTALYPAVAMILNVMVLSEPVSTRQILGMTIGILGIAILVTGR